MATRQELQSKLEEILGSRNVYYQPPETVKMEYPSIVYSTKNIKSTFANNTPYSMTKCYELVVIDRKSDNPVIDKLLNIPYVVFDRHYTADNLHHDVLTIYY